MSFKRSESELDALVYFSAFKFAHIFDAWVMCRE